MTHHIVKITDHNELDQVAVRTKDDGTLPVATVAALYPGATGLKYRLNDFFMAVDISNGHLNPPENGWSDITYFCVFPMSAKKTSLDTREELSPSANLLIEVSKTLTEMADINKKTLSEMVDSNRKLVERIDAMTVSNEKLITRLEQNESKFKETKALLYVKEGIKLIRLALNRFHNLQQFERLYCMAHGIIDKKTCPKGILKKKFKEFVSGKEDLEKMEEKIRPARNKRGHPIDDLKHVSLDELNEDLTILLCMKDHIVNDNDKALLNIMATYAGVQKTCSNETKENDDANSTEKTDSS